MTAEEIIDAAIRKRGYVVMAWGAGRKRGDVYPMVQRYGGFTARWAVVVLGETTYADLVEERRLIGGPPPAGVLPGMQLYRFGLLKAS